MPPQSELPDGPGASELVGVLVELMTRLLVEVLSRLPPEQGRAAVASHLKGLTAGLEAVGVTVHELRALRPAGTYHR